MKRVVLAFLLFGCAITLGAQTNNHMSFKGVPIDGTLDAYVKNMQKAGFSFIGKEDGIAILSGDFAGYRDCTIGVVTLKSLDLVNRITVLFDEQDNWADVYANYSQLKEMLSTKYGNPAECVEEFQNYNIPPKDDNTKMHELSMNRCVFSTEFSVDMGDIELEIIKLEFGKAAVRLTYWDRVNTAKIQQKAMDDL